MKLLHYNPFSDLTVDESTWTVLIDGKRYLYCVWGTNNMSGDDWYTVDDQGLLTWTQCPVPDDQWEDFEATLEETSDRYWELYQQRVPSVVNQINEEVFGAATEAHR